MGYYLNSTGASGLPALGKADCLIADCKAVRIPRPVNFPDLPGLALICVISNGPFEAAALVYSVEEFKEFSRPDDHRQKVWLTMDRKAAHELARYKEGAVGS